MSISVRPATWSEVEEGLAIQPRNRGDELVGLNASLHAWRHIFSQPFAACVAVTSSVPIQGFRQIGFGAAVILTRFFTNAELADPRPNINARLIADLCAGQRVLADRNDVARANASDGVDVLVLCPSCWREGILNAAQEKEVDQLLPSSFVEWLAGLRIRTILAETADDHSDAHVSRSLVFERIADFPQARRTLYAMTNKSVSMFSGHLGNTIFTYRVPQLRLKASHQQLLHGALAGGTDGELAAELGITFAAVKARWRSVFEQLETTMPGWLNEVHKDEGRGLQKRHRVLAYVRKHPEELQPYAWPP